MGVMEMIAKAKDWIAGATKKKGALHRALKVPVGKKISEAKLKQAGKSTNPKLRKEVALARTLEKLRVKRKKK